MSDVADQAADTTDRLHAMHINLLRDRVAAQGMTECEDCGEPIPAARLAVAAFATRCIHCQEHFEKGSRP